MDSGDISRNQYLRDNYLACEDDDRIAAEQARPGGSYADMSDEEVADMMRSEREAEEAYERWLETRYSYEDSIHEARAEGYW